MALTEKNKQFCREYIANRYNGTKAYLAVYPTVSYETASNNASRLLKKDECIEYIKTLQQEAVREYGDIAAMIARELVDDIQYRDDEGNHSGGWQKSVDLLSKNLGLQKQDISVKTTTISVGIEDE